MSNALGLTLIGIFIGGIILFVVVVQYVANYYPETRTGQVCKTIDEFIERFQGE